MNRVYRYGLLAPTEHADVVRAQMLDGHRYRNTLTEIERGRRDASRAIVVGGDIEALKQAVADADAELAAALCTVQSQRAKTRSRSEGEAQRDIVRGVRGRLKTARAALGAHRREARQAPEVIERAKAVYSTAIDLGKNAYAHSTLYWGTRALVDDAMKAVRKAPLYDGGEPNDPRFVRWSGEGHVGVQVHQRGANGRGLTVDDVHSCAGNAALWLQIERHAATRVSRRSRHRATLRMRVNSGDAGEPILASWPMVMHRPIPPGSIVRRASVSVRKIGAREEWSCEITIDEPVRAAPGASGTVAVHLGWLQTETGLRVATWMDDAGDSGSVMVDPEALTGFAKSQEIRSVRDKGFGEALETLVSWLRINDMPEWMRLMTVRRRDASPSKAQALAYLSGWRAPAKLAALARRWREARYDGDAEAFDALEAWRHHDYHLWQWETNQWTNSLRLRKNEYRKEAARISKCYTRVLMDGVKLDQIARKRNAEEKADVAAARSNRQSASASEFRTVVESAATGRGAVVERIAAAGLSTTCPVCDATDEAQKDIERHEFACAECGFTRDLDGVALLNMLKRGGCGKVVGEIIERGKRVGSALRADAA